MSVLFPDTSPEAEEVLVGLLREAPTWRKLHMLGQLNASMRALTLSGLRQRHPDTPEDEIQRRLADIFLRRDLAARVYGAARYE